MRISAIAAISKNRGLGKDGKLLFHIPSDFQRMKELTRGHPIIMGRKTYESIGRILPGRTNIIITHDNEYSVAGALVVGSFEEALEKAQEAEGSEEVFIFGGGQIYKEALPDIERLYLTVVDKEVEADAFFPDYKEFTKVIEKEERQDWDYPYSFLTLQRP